MQGHQPGRGPFSPDERSLTTTAQNTFTSKSPASGTGQTEAQAATSVFIRFGDWLSGASTDRSGMTEVTIKMMKEDCQLATAISEIRLPPLRPFHRNRSKT